MSSTDTYVALITSEHRQQPNYQAAVRALTQGFSDGITTLESLISLFNVETAGGDQLDTIGLWVGVTRRVPIPLVGFYFTWQDTVATGWAQGQWKGPTDPGTGIVSLSDTDFRLLIKAKIAANMWDGTIEQMNDILNMLFGNANVIVRDLVNSTYRISYSLTKLSAVQQALLVNDMLMLRPAGVEAIYVGF